MHILYVDPSGSTISHLMFLYWKLGNPTNHLIKERTSYTRCSPKDTAWLAMRIYSKLGLINRWLAID